VLLEGRFEPGNRQPLREYLGVLRTVEANDPTDPPDPPTKMSEALGLEHTGTGGSMTQNMLFQQGV